MSELKRSRRRVERSKASLLLASLLLILFVGVLGTAAFLVAQTQSVTNTFVAGNVPPVVEETFDGNVKSDVSIKNNGNVDAYIRAMIAVNWVKDSDGDGVYESVYGAAPEAGTDYKITYYKDTSAGAVNWQTYAVDDFYYWPQRVHSQENTGYLIKSCEPVEGKAPEGYVLSVEIFAQSIQADPDQAVIDAWGEGVAEEIYGIKISETSASEISAATN